MTVFEQRLHRLGEIEDPELLLNLALEQQSYTNVGEIKRYLTEIDFQKPDLLKGYFAILATADIPNLYLEFLISISHNLLREVGDFCDDLQNIFKRSNSLCAYLLLSHALENTENIVSIIGSTQTILPNFWPKKMTTLSIFVQVQKKIHCVDALISSNNEKYASRINNFSESNLLEMVSFFKELFTIEACSDQPINIESMWYDPDAQLPIVKVKRKLSLILRN